MEIRSVRVTRKRIHMPNLVKRKHIFISHHHKDDQLVDQLSDLLKGNGWDVRNSSIRAKPANQSRLDNGLVREEAIRRLLRMKISWSKAVLVLIGSDTHTRPWVNWEIQQANAQGKRIVGVFAQGGKDFTIPEGLEKYASAIVGWNTKSIIGAIDGGDNVFENPDGSTRDPVNPSSHTQC